MKTLATWKIYYDRGTAEGTSVAEWNAARDSGVQAVLVTYEGSNSGKLRWGRDVYSIPGGARKTGLLISDDAYDAIMATAKIEHSNEAGSVGRERRTRPGSGLATRRPPRF